MPNQAPPCTRCGQQRDNNIHLKDSHTPGYHPYVGGHTVFAADVGSSVVELDVRAHCSTCAALSFRVICGQQVREYVSRDKAAHEIGRLIMHALESEGVFDNAYLLDND